MKQLYRVLAYISYLFRSFHLHGIHSPFIYKLSDEIIRDKLKFYAFDQIEGIRAKLLLSNQEISFTDFGAKYKSPTKQKRLISEIVKSSSQERKYGEILFKIVKEFKTKSILEIGTSFGIGTSYLALPSTKNKVISLEGSAAIAKIAKLNHQKLGIDNVDLRVGEFNSTLDDALNDLKEVDMVYFDGNHEKQATLEYFNKCLAHSKESSIFIFDDIYWSKGMSEAWQEIMAHPKVTVTVDLYKIGIVFFKKDQAKENFTVYH